MTYGMELNTHGPGTITNNEQHINSDLKIQLPPSSAAVCTSHAPTDEATVSFILSDSHILPTENGNICTGTLPSEDGNICTGTLPSENGNICTGTLQSEDSALGGNFKVHNENKFSHVELHPPSSSTQPETGNEVTYSLVVKISVPPVPKKSPELYQDLEEARGLGSEGEAEQHHAGGENSREDGEKGEGEDPAYYSTIKEGRPSISEATPTGATSIGAKPIGATPIEGAFGGEYSEIEVDKHTQDVAVIYDNPDAFLFKNEPGENIYDIIYSESLQPFMFAKPPEQVLNKEGVAGEGIGAEEEEVGEVERGEEGVYAPIYSLPSTSASVTVLQFKPENIHRIKTLGTGYFGKVLLADTVGLSLKELKMSETDDDKSKSVHVAVKTLRQKQSRKRQEDFDKELKFMSRLSHPNVVRTLGVCMVDTPFIVMEYMEKGDLNGYLQDFDTIEQGSAPPTDLTISVGTLVSMSAQIADAMKYLASRNYIHRDLATRNCLVSAESKIKIADFGMSKNLYESHYYTIKGHIVLPVRWMAKECFYGKFSAKTDMWAFGVTMWEIFTLAKDIPYEDMDDSEVVADASRREGDRQLLQRSNDCPPEVYDVMMMCWKGEPSDRVTFETLHEALLSLDV